MIILIHIVIYYCLSLRVSASECVCVRACLPEERKADLYSQWHFAAALRETDAGYLWVTKERILAVLHWSRGTNARMGHLCRSRRSQVWEVKWKHSLAFPIHTVGPSDASLLFAVWNSSIFPFRSFRGQLLLQPPLQATATSRGRPFSYSPQFRFCWLLGVGFATRQSSQFSNPLFSLVLWGCWLAVPRGFDLLICLVQSWQLQWSSITGAPLATGNIYIGLGFPIFADFWVFDVGLSGSWA